MPRPKVSPASGPDAREGIVDDSGGQEDEDFVVSLSEDDYGTEVWAACCRICGECFPYLTWPDEKVIQRLEDHQHLDEPDFTSLLRMGGQPGNCDDNLMRAIGIPEELL